MRIISGKFKGKKILLPNDNKTRPLKDLTKESVFNIISHSKKFEIKLEDSIILDLFSGVGSFGIECLSRGANTVTFIENYQEVILILKNNLKNLNSNVNYEIIESDIYKNLQFKDLKKKFNLIFLDPPYRDKNIDKILTKIYDLNILDKNGIIILHRSKKTQDILPKYFSIIEEKTYGISKIIFLSLN